MIETDASDPPQLRKHQVGVDAFLALPAAERYGAMAVGLGANGHIADEVVLTAARLAHREHWSEERHYSQHLVQRVYRHIRGHVGKNSSWQKRGGGFDATVDDCAGFVLAKLAAEKSETCHAENAFGDYVYKRSLDYADEPFAKKGSQVSLTPTKRILSRTISASPIPDRCRGSLRQRRMLGRRSGGQLR